jgi:membrane protease YdiL (CAAX protease family)
MGFVFTKAAQGKILRYSALYVFPFLIMLTGGFALQLLTQKIEAGFLRTTTYAGLTLILAMGLAFIVRRSQSGLKMTPFIWGKPSSLLWGLVIGLAISATTGISFGISQGYPFHWENLFNNLAMNALGHASPALTEEIVFRAGIVHSTLLLFGKLAGLASGSIPFGILHLAGLLFGQSVTPAQVLGISLAGLMLSLMYLRFGILGAFATHLTWNTLVGGWINVYGLTDRGSAVSALEGSWVICLVLSIVCAILFFSPNREYAPALEEDWDVDLSQLERNLKLSPERRLIEHQAALELCEELARAGRRIHEQSQ